MNKSIAVSAVVVVGGRLLAQLVNQRTVDTVCGVVYPARVAIRALDIGYHKIRMCCVLNPVSISRKCMIMPREILKETICLFLCQMLVALT